jgi:hypothetical protein
VRTARPTQIAPPPARVIVVGEGWAVAATTTRPGGVLWAGGYDSETNTVHLGGGFGHPHGLVQARGDPSKPSVSGLTMFQRGDGAVYWANDSASLPRPLSPTELQSVQWGFELHFGERPVVPLTRIGDVPLPP